VIHCAGSFAFRLAVSFALARDHALALVPRRSSARRSFAKEGRVVIESVVLAFAVALLVTGLLIHPVIRLARHLDAMATPGGRHVHAQKTPRLGGLAIAAGYFTAIVFGVALLPAETIAGADAFDAPLLTGLVLGALGMVVLGFVDDTRGVRAKHKLLIQALVALGVCACGLRIDGVYMPFLGAVDLGIFAIPLTVLWIVGVINAINLIDGLDGLAGGVVVFAALTNFVVAMVAGNAVMAMVMAAVVGATLGFLRFNFNPARIFMGDSGSYFLGFLLATLSATSPHQKTSTAVSILVPLLALGLPIFDTLLAIVRRVLKRQPMFSPDRGHIHHLLLDLGLTPRRAVLILYATSMGFTVTACTIALGRDWEVGVALVVASAMVVGLVRFVVLPRRRTRRRAAVAESQRASQRPEVAPARAWGSSTTG
jgi:UDP-GlcNAc:undecaprenyl-phosphate/decaprenyl-phosphate GlcNAc-1-phosphate transferase